MRNGNKDIQCERYAPVSPLVENNDRPKGSRKSSVSHYRLISIALLFQNLDGSLLQLELLNFAARSLGERIGR